MSSNSHVTYLFHGADEPRLYDSLKELTGSLFSDESGADLNTTRIDGGGATLAEIESAASTVPFLADVRLVLVDNLSGHNAIKDYLGELPDMLESLPDYARLVFVETGLTSGTQSEQKRSRSRKSAIKKMEGIVEKDTRGRVMNYAKPRNPSAWIAERAQHHDAQIERDAAQELANRIGDDLLLADMELLKLATFVNGERSITVEDVDLLTPYTPEANIFHMVDALGQRRGDVALTLLNKLLEDGDEPLRIYALIVRQYRLLLQMKALMDDGMNVGAAASELNLHSYVGGKIGEQARRYSMAALEKVYRHLLQVDVALKGQQLVMEGMNTVERMNDPAMVLQALITRLAGRD